MLKKTLASLLLAASLLACSDRAPQVIAVPMPTDTQKAGSFVIHGSATMQVAPDCADLLMTLTADAGKPGNATAAVQAKQQALIGALTKLGIETADLKVSTLTLEPIYANNPDGWSTLKVATYRASISITATTHKFEMIAPMLQAGAESGTSSMSTQFRRSDLEQLKAKVREMALLDAKAKAAQTVKTLGIDLGRIVSINEAPNAGSWDRPYVARAETNDVALVSQQVVTLGAETQTLVLDVQIGFELPGKA
jgi:uncharacterized protein